MVLAYDGKTDRLADAKEKGATLDFEGLHEKGNASLILQEAEVRHSGMYICSVYLPHIVAQVTLELEIVGKGKCMCFMLCVWRHTCMPLLYE